MALRVGLLIATPDSYGRRVLDGVVEYVRAHPLWQVEFDAWRDPQHVPDLSGLAGAIVRVSSDRMASRLERVRLPMVNVSTSRQVMPKLPAVVPDNHEAGRLTATDLIERGFHHLAFIGHRQRQYAEDRAAGFRDEARRHGIEPAEHWLRRSMEIGWPSERVMERLREWLVSLPKPMGVLASNDLDARLMLHACRRAGIDVPDQAAIVGVDNDEHLCELSNPPLSSVDLGLGRVGYRAAALLDEMMKGNTPPRRPVILPPGDLVLRRSSDAYAVSDRRVVEALRLIHERSTVGVSIGDLARQLRLSRRSLEMRFQKAVGRTPRDEVRRVRLMVARRLLGKQMSIAQVAAESGFGHQARFGQIFKQETGLTPSEYRRRLSGDNGAAEPSLS